MGLEQGSIARTDMKNTDEWSMNYNYLAFLMMLIMKFGEARLNKDFDLMYSTLRLLETTLSPKLDKDDTEKDLDTIDENIEKMEKRDDRGRVVCYYPKLMRTTLRLIDETYGKLLIKMDERGILTQKKDMFNAMGRMGSS